MNQQAATKALLYKPAVAEWIRKGVHLSELTDDADLEISREIPTAANIFKKKYNGTPHTCNLNILVNISMAAVYDELRTSGGRYDLPTFDAIHTIGKSARSVETEMQANDRRKRMSGKVVQGLLDGDWFFTCPTKNNPWNCKWDRTNPVAVFLKDSFHEWAKRVRQTSSMGKYTVDCATGVLKLEIIAGALSPFKWCRQAIVCNLDKLTSHNIFTYPPILIRQFYLFA